MDFSFDFAERRKYNEDIFIFLSLLLGYKQQKKNSLMETAFQLFTSKGIANTTISDIVEMAGVAKGTFYLYFKDKYDLNEKLIIHRSEQLMRHALEHSGYEKLETNTDKLLVIMDDILFQLKENPLLLRFLNKRISWELFYKVIEKNEEGYAAVFKNIPGQDDAGRKNLEIELFTIIEMVSAVSYSVILTSDPVSLEEFLPYLHRSIRAIVASFHK